MDAYNLSYTSHSTRFLKLLKENVPVLNDSKLHGVNYVSIKEKNGKDAEELLNPRTLYDMMERISKAIRIKLENVNNEFKGSFMKESPLPCKLLILLNQLTNGSNHEEPGFAQSPRTNHFVQPQNPRKEQRVICRMYQRRNADKFSSLQRFKSVFNYQE